MELCQLARELNAMFETQMTVEMVAYLITLIRFFRYICTQIRIDKDVLILSLIDWINMCFWVFLYVVSLFCLNYTCESVSAKVNFHIIYNMYIYIFIYLFICSKLLILGQRNECSTS